MAVYVKDGGTWRETSELYVRDSTSFTNKTVLNGYVKNSGSWEEFYTLFTTTSYSSSAGSVAVPTNANAIHFQYAVGGGSGGYRGADYDKAGGESAGPAGGSGAYVSDVVFAVTSGETLTINVGSAGAAGTGTYSGSSGAGGNTTVTGSTTGAILTLNGGGASSVSGGGVQGPLRSNSASTGGTLGTLATRLTTGTTTDGLNITTFTSGPVGSFNQAGAGVAGTNPGNCGGDNCTIGGGTGGASYAGNVSGGAGGPNGSSGGTAGTRGSGGGGGGTEPGSSGGAAGGAGEVYYRFMRTT
tara:strand:+ start:256 stop:1152 length:897 start_codon:yes stop_codon:yes gene_type:complete